MTLANAEVVERFVLHQEGKGKHLRSDGETLWSYRTPIARWTSLGLVSDVSWFSMTTAIHQSLLWNLCKWDFYPWDDLRGDVPLEEMARAEGVAVASKKAGSGHLFFRIAGEKCEYVYCSNHRLVEHLDQRRFLSGLEVSALLEYAKRRGWERRRIGEALLSGDRAKLLAALLLEEKMRFDGEKFKFLCPHCGAECDSIEVKTIDTFLCGLFETSEEHIEIDHWPEADPVTLFVCPECGEELDGRDVEEGVERWLKRLRKSRKKYAKWLSENILEVCTMGYRIRIEGGVRISNGKHEFVIDTYYRKVEIDGMALYYLNSDEAAETLNELLNREEIAPEEMNYLRGVSLLDYRRHRKWLERFKDRPIGELKRAVLLSYILGSDWEGEKKRLWLIENGYSEGELKARKIAYELLEEKVLVGEYRGRKFYYNQFWMEIYEELPGGRLRKKRDFHKWEQLIQWRPEYNILACESINKMNGFLEERMEELLKRLKRENPKEYAKTVAEMLERRPEKYILQVDGSNHLGEDGDGNPLFEIPPEGLYAWIQDESGEPTAGDRYIRLRIKRDGEVEAELQFGGRMETLLRAKVGTLELRFRAPLWLEVVNDTKYRLSFSPPREENILSVIELAKPENILVDGSAYRGHLYLKVELCYWDLEKALRAIDRLSKAGVLKGVPDIRKAILRNIGGVLPGDIPKGLLGFLSPRVPSFTLESPEKQNYIDGVALLDPRQRGKWLLRFGELPIEKLKRAVLLSYILDKGWRREEKKQWLIRNGYSEAELRARKIAHELLEEYERSEKKDRGGFFRLRNQGQRGSGEGRQNVGAPLAPPVGGPRLYAPEAPSGTLLHHQELPDSCRVGRQEARVLLAQDVRMPLESELRPNHWGWGRDKEVPRAAQEGMGRRAREGEGEAHLRPAFGGA